jgi:hypothetical protein
MATTFKHPIIGQEAICLDGLGRVTAYRDDFPHCWIQIKTYVGNRECQWAPENVQLVEIGECYSATATTNK